MEMGYQRMIVWKKAMDVVVEAYDFVKHLPSDERFALSSQIRRAAVSIPANIAEGYCRAFGSQDWYRFVRIALGSAIELETHLMIVERTRLAPVDRINLMRCRLRDVIGLLYRIVQPSERKGPGANSPDP